MPLVRRVLLAIMVALGTAAPAAAAPPQASPPSFGPNVIVFDPSMPTSAIQAAFDAVLAQQVANQFGTQRNAFLFKPGTYGSPSQPLALQVGYYTSLAGLGSSPNDVTINGTINVYNQCLGPGACTALVNFWRSVENLSIVVPAGKNEIWAVSQAAPLRRVHVTGNLFLFDFQTSPGFSSGGFIADSQIEHGVVINGSQQQFLTRNSSIEGWTNGVWNQVFAGVVGAPPQSFSSTPFNPPPYTTLPTSPITQERPFLTVDADGHYHVFVPTAQRDTAGTTWAAGPTAGTSLPIERFFLAQPSDSVARINAALAAGKDLLLLPGVYHLDRPIQVTHPDALVLGLGFPTLVPQTGRAALQVTNGRGVQVAGLLFDAGPVNSPVLLRVGARGGDDDDEDGDPGQRVPAHDASPVDPTVIQDVFFRIGGASPGRATTSLVVNASHVILDDIWAWRADHGNGVGWTDNTAQTGVVVNGDDVTAYGLFVEHYQQNEVIWRGEDGRVIMFQNEMPYDPPDQAAWSHDGTLGWAAFKVADRVQRFEGWGLGSYCFFHVNPSIHASHAFEVPVRSGVQLHDLLTVSLGGVGVIDHVVNDVGAPAQGVSTTPVNVVSYPPAP